MASDGLQPAASPIASSERLPKRQSALVALPFILVGMVALARLATPFVVLSPDPRAGAETASPTELSSSAAAVLTRALAPGGGGIEFEIVQVSTIAARPGGPLVELPDPIDRRKSLGLAERYSLDTMIQRGFATPDGYWMEMLQGPRAESKEGYTLDTARIASRALVKGPELPPVRALEATTTAEDIPGIIAVDLAEATESTTPARLAFDDAGRLVTITILARNTLLEVHDLLVETVITFRYPTDPPELPKPEPAFVEPAPADEKGSGS